MRGLYQWRKDAEMKKKYRKPQLRKLGLLRQVTWGYIDGF